MTPKQIEMLNEAAREAEHAMMDLVTAATEYDAKRKAAMERLNRAQSKTAMVLTALP